MKRIFFALTPLIGIAMLSTSCNSAGSNAHKDSVANNSTNTNGGATANGSQDTTGWTTLFNGKDFTGFRGYDRTDMPKAWTIDGDAIKINGSGQGEAGGKDGGDIIYATKYKNFELSFEWKVSKGGNSGVFYLAQEVKGEPIWKSSPEYQVLDNENHPDAKLGKDGNRQSASLYDLIPAKPQNAKPAGEWNTGGIMVYKGTVVHKQNGENVVEYHLWTDDWKKMIEGSKFKGWENFINAGGPNQEGYIGFQDHGDNVWFRNIKIKVLE